MKDGFIKVCAATPQIRVADVLYNSEQITNDIKEASKNGAALVVFPELCITGYSAQDLFFEQNLIEESMQSLFKIAQDTKDLETLSMVGLPVMKDSKLYNCAAYLFKGKVIAIAAKKYIFSDKESYEERYFSVPEIATRILNINNEEIPFGPNIFIKDTNNPQLVIATEIGNNMDLPVPPSAYFAAKGATLIVNPSAKVAYANGKKETKDALLAWSKRINTGYIHSSGGMWESTQDCLYSGYNVICEAGELLAYNTSVSERLVYSEIDLCKIVSKQLNTKMPLILQEEIYDVYISIPKTETSLSRHISKTPFLPEDEESKNAVLGEIFSIQTKALVKRLLHTNTKKVVVGISGGLDSALSLLVCKNAFEMANLPSKDIMAVTMPCFGTTSHTLTNAENLCKLLCCSIQKIDIKESVLKHFEDIGHDKDTLDVVYENSQARERTQVLMDLANKYNALVIGTGDMSELALGWATYNGDHMSMYATNTGAPKTLVRELVEYVSNLEENKDLKKVLKDILKTPVSPELLPPKDGEIAQKTEGVLGPYILHDFFLYYLLTYGFSPKKIYRIATYAFLGEFSKDEILKTLTLFYRRFFSQQFKRSCMPDGAGVFKISLSPRGYWRMPSDASWALWKKEIEELEKR